MQLKCIFLPLIKITLFYILRKCIFPWRYLRRFKVAVEMTQERPPNRKHKYPTLQARKSHPPVHIYERFSLWGSTDTLGQNFPRPGHWPSEICSFIPSTSFFCSSSMLGTRYDPRWIGHSAYPQGDCLGRKQKKSTTQGHQMRREGAPGHVGGGEAGRVGLL